ncbi:hypothetical protein H0H81_002852 [Sphagnurus paluster]|uniref:DDE Tnp4 domain-containing protein n=1 Tax=Sphagnurus paluster TaxID=117069 RepID=A0A9P7GGJ2_9AGAR|nr:hypothetical protein H0H81_002852 [Sphagnurus paluster]
MPRVTDRQQQTNALLDAFVVHLLAKLEADAFVNDSDSDSDSDSDNSDLGFDDDPIAEGLIESIEQLEISESFLMITTTVFPDIFRSYVQVTPECFDALVGSVQNHPVFHNNSNCQQMPVEDQVAIALYRFEHYGNAASTMKITLWAGVSYGTVKNITVRVMTAICDPRFQAMTMPWSTPAEIERAKAWVEGNSCAAWRDGWLMVDGTFVPLFQQPHHFGNTYFDQKSNYSMNVQLINRPDLTIADYGIGLPGSQHDATAWSQTQLPSKHEHLLRPGEFVWADSAYPLKSWCQAPYKECIFHIVFSHFHDFLSIIQP